MKKYQDVSERAYAKINLHLDVTGRRDDGFHDVVTVMQTISLYDIITISNIHETNKSCDFSVICDKEGVPTDSSNLVVKAAKALCAALGISLGGTITIEKNIPMAAGMAGGSADGAAVLRGLNRALGEPFGIKELCTIGESLGSDVPFCIACGTAYADGRGEKLRTLPPMPDCFIVASCEGEGVSTPWAYRLLDSVYKNFENDGAYRPVSTEKLENALVGRNLEKVTQSIYNIFEEPVLKQRPVANGIKTLMLECGAMAAVMSGSGPSIFGIFEDETSAKACALSLEKKEYKAFVCSPTQTMC